MKFQKNTLSLNGILIESTRHLEKLKSSKCVSQVETETILFPTILSHNLAVCVQMRVRNRVDSSRFLALVPARRNIITNYSATL